VHQCRCLESLSREHSARKAQPSPSRPSAGLCWHWAPVMAGEARDGGGCEWRRSVPGRSCLPMIGVWFPTCVVSGRPSYFQKKNNQAGLGRSPFSACVEPASSAVVDAICDSPPREVLSTVSSAVSSTIVLLLACRLGNWQTDFRRQRR